MDNKLTKGSDFQQIHHGTEGGTWQTRMAAWIRDNTGIHIHSYKLMPGKPMRRVPRRDR